MRTNPPRWSRHSACPRGGRARFAVIWTTTAWTIPANQALNLNPELDDLLVEMDRGCWCWPVHWWRSAWKRYHLHGGTVVATVKGEQLANLNFRHPGINVDRLPPPAAAVPGRLRHRRGRHRIRALSPAYGLGDFNNCVAYGLASDDISTWRRATAVRRRLRPLGARTSGRQRPRHRSAGQGWPLFAPRGFSRAYRAARRVAVTYRAAAQRSRGWTRPEGVFTKEKAPATLRQWRWRRSRKLAPPGEREGPGCAR